MCTRRMTRGLITYPIDHLPAQSCSPRNTVKLLVAADAPLTATTSCLMLLVILFGKVSTGAVRSYQDIPLNSVSGLSIMQQYMGNEGTSAHCP